MKAFFGERNAKTANFGWHVWVRASVSQLYASYDIVKPKAKFFFYVHYIRSVFDIAMKMKLKMCVMLCFYELMLMMLCYLAFLFVSDGSMYAM
jgi:hypothetical protein